MRNRLNIFFLLFCLLVTNISHAQINELQRSTPEAEGVPSRAVIALFDSLTALPQTDIHSVIILRHGKVIAETYPCLLYTSNAEQPNSRWYSGCGIYRNVWLTKVNPVHVAQWGTYVTAEEVSKNSARLVICTKLQLSLIHI